MSIKYSTSNDGIIQIYFYWRRVHFLFCMPFFFLFVCLLLFVLAVLPMKVEIRLIITFLFFFYSSFLMYFPRLM